MLMSSIDPSRRRTETSPMKVDLGVKTKTQLMAERSVFKVLLMIVIAACAEPELQHLKDDFAPNVCCHFAMIFHVDSTTSPLVTAIQVGGSMGTGALSSKSRNSSHANLKELDPLIFLDALVDVLAAENRAHAKAALNGLNIFTETLLFLAHCKHTGVLTTRGVGMPGTPMMVSSPSMNPVYSPPPGVRIPVFEQLPLRLLRCCYGSTWQAQMSGVMGLRALVGKATVETLCLFQVRAIRGLVSVLKRLPQHANKEQEETSQVFTQVLRVVDNVDEANSEHRKQSFQGVVDFLATEFFNPNATLIVRKNVQSCLALLASRTGSEVSELLEPLYQPLLQPLITRPLRSKHIEQQVGIVMALNFCLALRPPLLMMTQELVNILQEALQIAEADETILIGKIENYMSVDVEIVNQIVGRVHELWSTPIQISIALLIVFGVIRFAALAGLATMIIVMVICLFLASKQQKYMTQILSSKDNRMKVTNEAISNMKIIKLQAWHEWFHRKVDAARGKERIWIRGLMYYAAITIFLLWLSPLAVSVISFGSCVLMHIELTPGRVFTAIATFRIL